MQNEGVLDGSVDVGSSPVSSTQQISASSIRCAGSSTRTLPAISNALSEPETTLSKAVSPTPTSTSPGRRSLSPVNQHRGATRFDTEHPPNLSTSTTWDVPSLESTCFSPAAQASDSSIRKRSTIQRAFDRSWVQPTIGLTTLLITLIALFVYSHRSFVMAKWTEENDLLQACAQLVQSRPNATYLQCDELLAKGPHPPPYLPEKIHRRSTRIAKPDTNAIDTTKAVLSHRIAPDYTKITPRLGESDFGRSRVGFNRRLPPRDLIVMMIFLFCALLVLSATLLLLHRLQRSRKASTASSTGSTCRTVLWTFRGFPETVNIRGPFRSEHQQQRSDAVRVLKDIRRRVHRPSTKS